MFNQTADEIVGVFTSTISKLKDVAERKKEEIKKHEETILATISKKNAAATEALKAEKYWKKLEAFFE